MTADLPSPRLPVLIFGQHIAALGVLRALAARRIACYVVGDQTDVITRSRWYRSPGPTLEETADSSQLADYLLSLALERAVLIACNDQWALAVAGLPAQVQDRFMASSPPRDAIEQLADKDLFGALVSRLDIPHPRTVHINSPADLDQVTDEQLVNGFLKPTSSQLHRDAFGTKGSFVDSREAAVRRVQEAAALGIEFVFQEWIPGKHASSILIDGLVDRTGTIKALTARRRVREYPPRLGTTTSSVGIPLKEVAEPVADVKRLLADISYRGIFNIEFKFDSRDGHYKIIEFNPRVCWYTGMIARGGVDLPWMAYLDAQGLPVPQAGSYPAGRHAYYEFRDASAILLALRSRRRPEGSTLRTWLTGDRAIFWWKDPVPAIAGAGQALGRRIVRMFGRSRRTPIEGSRPGA